MLSSLKFLSRRFLLVLLFLFNFFLACKQHPEASPEALPDTAGDSLQVVTTWCSKCHLFPEPGLLTKKIWQEKVLPNMGFRLGIHTIGYTPMESADMMEQELIHETKVYPDHQIISNKDWTKITAYMIRHAPDSIDIPQDHVEPLHDFEVNLKGDLIQIPKVTLLKYDSLAHVFHIGLESGKIFTYDRHWIRQDSIQLHSTPIDYAFSTGGDYILTIGKMYPTERKVGALFQYRQRSLVKLLDALHRPVSISLTDINADHHEDVLICEFGFETGSFSWFEIADSGIIARPRTLQGVPGAIKSIIEDMDGDGIKDIVVLLAQGNEHVSIYKMNILGIEQEYDVLQFDPLHGACDMDIKDFNQDGKQDLIIANGDNADYSQIVKPFHGITIYLNQGNMKFVKSQFIPYPGALHCIASDFDHDGDLDIVATSFFPGDAAHPYAPFKYFEQRNGKFIGRTFDSSNRGKWMEMIVGDFDQDGYEDILLGSFLLNTYLVVGNNEELRNHSLVLLRNKGSKASGINLRGLK